MKESDRGTMSESDSGVEAGSDTESLGEMSVGSSAPSEDEAIPQVRPTSIIVTFDYNSSF